MTSQPTYISHRGYHEQAVENTFEAFKLAIDQGFTHLETDLHVSADNHLVIAHDPDLKRLAGIDRRVTEMTRAEIEQIGLGQNSKILFFDELIHHFKNHHWLLDIKPINGAHCIEVFFKFVDDHGLTNWVKEHIQFLCWEASHEKLLKTRFNDNHFYYARMNECYRSVFSCLLHMPFLAGLQKGKTYAIPPRFKGINLYEPYVIEAFHEREAKVIAFLPETKQEYELAITVGCDEILTNHGLPEDIKK